MEIMNEWKLYRPIFIIGAMEDRNCIAFNFNHSQMMISNQSFHSFNYVIIHSADDKSTL